MTGTSRFTDSHSLSDSTLYAEDRKIERISQATPVSVLFDFLCLIAVAAITLAVYIATGFYSGINSLAGHMTFGGVMFIYLLIMFRRGLGLEILGFRYFWQKRE